MKHAALLLAAALLAACAAVDPYRQAPIAQHLARNDAVGECARLLRDVDRRIDSAGARDAMAPRVGGFPYLRVDRFAAALSADAADGAAVRAWRDRLDRLGAQARAIELTNAGPGRGTAPARIDECVREVAAADASNAAAVALLRQNAVVPDDYSLAMRAVGLYPLAKIPFAAGVRNWQDETREVFALPLAQLPVSGRLTRYVLATNADGDLPQASEDALGVPLLTPAQRDALLQRYAPVLDVDTASDDDRIGRPHWRSVDGAATHIAIATAQPAAYTRLAYTRIAGRVHLQLVYTFWFPARPKQGAFDTLGGALDGLIWRVTLDRDFTPLVYDSIHPCGCYHQFFPTARLRAKAPPPEQGAFDEGLFAPQAQPAPAERVLLRVASRTHYLQRVAAAAEIAAPETVVSYALHDDDELRTLAYPGGGTRSAFDADGLIAGSERLERFLFWPMGIASAGQMRQWGRHATAFVGRRHFDDPGLIGRYFEVVRSIPTGIAD
jgi:hypothetical protein